MKNLLRLTHLLCFIFLLNGCTADSTDSDFLNESPESELNQPPCIDDDPITRVINNGTIAFDLKVIDDQGNVLVDIVSIPPSTTTSWASFVPGEILFSIDGNDAAASDEKVVLQMNTCMAYEIEIDSNNEVVSYTPTTL
ncbi:hypothetical protein [Winogradskyella sp. PE311]|uniref:hypothetical protein n=1 Tax=Winogradskyella sp. PE311 TaxID=3366943 RepID=UPI003980AC39